MSVSGGVMAYCPVQPEKGRKRQNFSNEEICLALKQIRDRMPPKLSAYHIRTVLYEQLHFVKYDLQKIGVGKGRKTKVYSLTEAGEKFLKENEFG